MNIDGAGYYANSRPAAERLVRQAISSGVRNVDVGCMQVSLMHHPTAFRATDDASDPDRNVDYAARFLTRLHEAAGGNWFIAAGLYHTRRRLRRLVDGPTRHGGRRAAIHDFLRWDQQSRGWRACARHDGRHQRPVIVNAVWYHSRTPDLARACRERLSLATSTIRAAGKGRVRVTLANGRIFTINTARQPTRSGRHRSACEIATILGPYAAAPVRAEACARARPTPGS